MAINLLVSVTPTKQWIKYKNARCLRKFLEKVKQEGVFVLLDEAQLGSGGQLTIQRAIQTKE